MSDVHVVFYPDAVREILSSLEARQYMQWLGDEVAAVARERAPHQALSHGGAESIGSQPAPVSGTWGSHIGWDRLHYYMWFPERGTRYQPAQYFIENALDRYAALGR